jgi:hypothetical protein
MQFPARPDLNSRFAGGNSRRLENRLNFLLNILPGRFDSLSGLLTPVFRPTSLFFVKPSLNSFVRRA